MVPETEARVEATVAPESSRLRIGVAGFYNPRVMYMKYQPLADYLTRRTGREWELFISISYQDALEALCGGQVDVALLGPFTYLRAREMCGAEPLVQLRTRARNTYSSYIMVREDSPYRELEDLKGKRIGFGSRLSTSSHLVPRQMLLDAGVDLRDGLCLYFDHHERAARAVQLGEVDACGVRDVIGKTFMNRGLRVLARSDGIPNFPLVVSESTSAEVRALLIGALVRTPETVPDAYRELRLMDEELRSGFSRCVDSDFDEIRAIAEQVFGPDALRLPEKALGCPSTEVTQ